MAITLFGVAYSHSDETADVSTGGGTYTSRSITPPSSMVAGQLVIIDAWQRDSALTYPLVINNDGGQTWTAETATAGGSATGRRFWCRFNGTWDADPSVNFDDSGSSPISAVMTVWSPTVAGSTWTVDVAQETGGITVSSTTLTCPSMTTNTSGAIVVSGLTSFDENSSTLTTAGNWTSAIIGHDNTGGANGLCVSVHYCITVPAGATGTYVLTEQDVGQNDNARYFNQAWYETAPATTKKLKLLAHSSAASATGVEGWVVDADNTTYYGKFTGAAFEADLEDGEAVLKVAVSEFGGEALTTSDTPSAVVKNATYGTSMVACTVIEE